MENFIFVFNAIAPLFMFMGAGFLLRVLKVADDNFASQANSFCIKLSLPVMLFCNMYIADLKRDFDPGLLACAIIALAALAAATAAIFSALNLEYSKRVVMIQCAYHSNHVLFGLSVMTKMYGRDNIGTAAVLSGLMTPIFIAVTASFLTLCENESGGVRRYANILSRVVKSPLIISAAAGLLFNLLSITVPDVIFDTANDISRTATPIAFVALGAQLKLSGMAKNRSRIAAGAALKLLIAPAAVITPAILLGYRGTALAAMVFLSSSPKAVASYIMTSKSQADKELAAQQVAVTSLFSAFTVFVIVYVLRSFEMI